MDRRTVLKRLVEAMGLVVVGIVGVPALVVALSPALRRRRPVWRPIGALDDFPPGTMTHAIVEVVRDDEAQSLRHKGVYVWRPTDQPMIVFSRNCTDLSCPVVWDPGSQWFLCPCHGGVFDERGQRVAGPPDRPLYRYANRVRDGMVEIDLNSLPPMT